MTMIKLNHLRFLELPPHEIISGRLRVPQINVPHGVVGRGVSFLTESLSGMERDCCPSAMTSSTETALDEILPRGAGGSRGNGKRERPGSQGIFDLILWFVRPPSYFRQILEVCRTDMIVKLIQSIGLTWMICNLCDHF